MIRFTLKGLGWLLRGVIRGYQLLVSPLSPPNCRYLPTCSEYAIDALTMYGPFRGLWLTILRTLRCHPWGGSGFDPVPHQVPKHSRVVEHPDGH